MSNISEKIIKSFQQSYSADGYGDNVPESMFSGLTSGVVVDTDDPLQQGRLRIFCPNLNDNPKKIDSIPWSAYISPYGGVINNSEYYRGVDPDNATSKGSLHYGFWAIPEMGAHVLVGCIDGDPRRRFWLGCLPEHQQTNTMHHGRYRWNKGAIDGPLTGDGEPMQPLFDNMLEAFDDQNDRPEFLSRAVEYQVSSNSETVGQQPNSKNSELDQENEQIKDNSPDEWTHPTLGAHGNDWSGFKKLGAYLSSRTFGMSSPGMHAITMDDRPFNQRVRFRTTNGHQVILDDTNERIYVSTAKGETYFEMDQRGDIHVYASKNINFHAEDNFNINADKIRLYARRGIHGYCGSQYVLQDSFELDGSDVLRQEPLIEEPQDGEIRFHSAADFHIKSETNIRQLSLKDTYMEANGSWYGKVDVSSFYQVAEEINVITDTGDYSLNVGKNLNETIKVNSKRLSYGNTAVASGGNAEFMSFGGTTDIGALNNVNMKSSTGDVSMDASGNTSGTGGIIITTPQSQFSVGDNGITAATTSAIKMKAVDTAEISLTSQKPNLSSPLAVQGLPEVDVNATPVGPTGPLPWDGSRSNITIDEAVRVAYNAGWRGKDLTTAVAVMMAESSLKTSVTNKAAVTNETWGDVVGLFQIRTLKDAILQRPGLPAFDRVRDNRNHQLENPNNNAAAAYVIWAQSAPPKQWTVGKWQCFQHPLIKTTLPQAAEAVNRYFGISQQSVPQPTPFSVMFDMPDGLFSIDNVDNDLPDFGIDPFGPINGITGFSSGITPSSLLGASGLSGGIQSAIDSCVKLDKKLATLQAQTDIDLRSVQTGHEHSFNKLSDKINEISNSVNQYGSFLNETITQVTKGLAEAYKGSFTLKLPFSIPFNCLDFNIFAMLPPELLQVASSIQQLNDLLADVLEVPVTIYNIKEQLEGNVDALMRLGLPVDFKIELDPSIGNCLKQLDKLTSTFGVNDIPVLQTEKFSDLTQQIMVNNAITKQYRIPLGG